MNAVFELDALVMVLNGNELRYLYVLGCLRVFLGDTFHRHQLSDR